MSRSTRLSMFLLMLAVATLLLTAIPVLSFPYGKHSPIVELTPATLPGFVSTHKPVVILFYAPWCGHCKHFHPEFERFAEAVKGTMRVGALNADQHASVAQQYGIRGFPTVKYWPMGSKSLASPLEYQGQRTAVALQNAMVSEVTPSLVVKVSTTEQLKQVLREAPLNKVGVLFSAKAKVPPLLSIMTMSPKLKELPLIFAGNMVLGRGMAEGFNIRQLPTIGLMQYTAGTPSTSGSSARTGAAEGEEKFELVPYMPNKIGYEPVAHFFLDCLSGQCPASLRDYKHISRAEMHGVDADGGHDDDDRQHAQQHRHLPGDPQGEEYQHPSHTIRPHYALPVEPLEFTDETITQWCSPQTVRMHGQAPICVLSMSSNVDLKNLHSHFHHDPLLFFDATAHQASVLKQFQDLYRITLTPASDAQLKDAVVLLRHGKVSSVRHMLVDDVDSDSKLQNILQKVLNGERRLEVTHI